LACQKSSLPTAATAALSGDTARSNVPSGSARLHTSSDTGRLRLLALGDSYTIGQSVDETDRYPIQLVKKLCTNDRICFEKPEIIATTGWTTANLLDALSSENPAGPYQAVTLLIGVNNQFQGRPPQEYKTQFAALLQLAITLAGNQPSHVLVLSIPDYSVTPFGRSAHDPATIAAQIDSFNVINQDLATDNKVKWLDLTAESRKAATDPTLIAADGLHFSGKEYEIWARLMEPVIAGIVR
jgi:lysophospholipase L1-like esterase